MNEDDLPNDLFSGIEDAKGIPDDRTIAKGSILHRFIESAFGSLERPRGILSQTDREYLCRLTNYKHAQTEANRKQKIRERIVHALQDYSLLWWALDEDERNKVFHDEIDENRLHDSLQSIITFIYLGLKQDKDHFEQILESGIYVGANFDKEERWTGEATDVNVSINIEYNPNVEELLQRLENGEGDQLTPAEIGVLVRAGKLDSDDLDELEDNGPKYPGFSVKDTSKTKD